MSREYRFRGKPQDKLDKRDWVYGYYAQLPSDGGRASLIFNGKEWIGVVGSSVGEFTGLLDKKGVEIWEGDILKTWIPIRPRIAKENCEVTFGDGVFLCGDYPLKLIDGEVIGNIYENPSLLEVK